jgi:uncharacterized protein YegP (UPF0339 family)
MKTPKVELYKDKGGKFRFRVVAVNGEPIASSEGYNSMASAKSTAKRLSAILAKAVIVNITKMVRTSSVTKK